MLFECVPGYQFQMDKNFTAALEYYTEAERMRPGYPEPLLNMAGIYKELGNVSDMV